MSAALGETLRLNLTVNGRALALEAEPRTHLGDVLRDRLDLTGTHLGCEHGVCGACTVLLDGEPARACLTFAGACEGAAVMTIEGLDADEIATELRAAFNREHALQCGYCTPGMLVVARDLVLRLGEPDERRIRVGLSGNLCRCTGYVGIVRAVRSVIADRRARGIPARTAVDGRGVGPVGARLGALRPTEADGAAGPRPQRIGDASFKAAPATPERQDDLSSFVPAQTFEQSVTVAHLPDRVFALLADIETVAACLPGAVLTGRPAPDRIEGELNVKIGPIRAAFQGHARIERDEATRSGRIVGSGRDTGGRSGTQGEIRYRVLPGETPGTSRIALAIGYTLSGPLAQFGRPGLVRDLAGRIAAEFTERLDERLAGGTVRAAPAGLNPLRLVWQVVRARIGGLLGIFRA